MSRSFRTTESNKENCIMADTMKAIILEEPMKYSLQEVHLPKCPEGGMLIKVIACGLCGSDLRTLKADVKIWNIPGQ